MRLLDWIGSAKHNPRLHRAILSILCVSACRRKRIHRSDETGADAALITWRRQMHLSERRLSWALLRLRSLRQALFTLAPQPSLAAERLRVALCGDIVLPAGRCRSGFANGGNFVGKRLDGNIRLDQAAVFRSGSPSMFSATEERRKHAPACWKRHLTHRYLMEP